MEMAYKQYPCCRFFHAQLDCFIDIIEENNFLPEEIGAVRSYALPFVANPAPLTVQTQVDVQFSLPFCLSVAAHRVKTGADWQDWETIRNPRIRSFMKKVTMIVDPVAMEAKRKDPRSWPARIEVEARGKIFSKQTRYARGTNFTDYRATDNQLIAKFRSNSSRLLRQDKIDKAVEQIMALEKVKDVTELTSLLV
jgi:2-methylcitrate dehydratase PrpD